MFNPIQIAVGFVGGVASYGLYTYLTGEEETVEDVIDNMYLEAGPVKTAKFLVKEEWCDDAEEAQEAVEEWEDENPKSVARYQQRAVRKAKAAEAASAAS